MKAVNLSVDSRKRISLSKLLPELPVSSVRAYLDDGKIILEPMVEIPAREAWLYQNEKSLKDVRTGLSEKGTVNRGSFAEYVEDQKCTNYYLHSRLAPEINLKSFHSYIMIASLPAQISLKKFSNSRSKASGLFILAL